MQIRPILGADRPEWLRMRRALWPGPDDHPGEIAAFFDAGRGPAVVFVADREAGGALAGFIELSLRSYAEGCHTSPVPYVEGWWVDEDARRAGVGRALVEAGEQWARERGHTEMASDAAPDNEISLRAHAALGFEEADRVVCFRKGLGGG